MREERDRGSESERGEGGGGGGGGCAKGTLMYDVCITAMMYYSNYFSYFTEWVQK